MKPHWKDFEERVGAALSSLGWKVELTKASNDFGADVVATSGRDRLVVQCKYFIETRVLQSAAVREVMMAKQKYKARLGLLAYRGVVSRRTYEYAMNNKVALLTIDQLVPGCFFDRRVQPALDLEQTVDEPISSDNAQLSAHVSCPACKRTNRLPLKREGIMKRGHCGVQSYQRT